MIAYTLLFFQTAKDLDEIPMGSPLMEAPNNIGRIGKNDDFRPASRYISETVQDVVFFLSFFFSFFLSFVISFFYSFFFMCSIINNTA